MKFKLASTVTGAFHKAGFQLKKHSPEILVVTGVVGTIVGAVMACKATTKVSAIVEKSKEDIDTIHECAENPEFAEEYTPEDAKKDLTIVYAKTAFEVGKLYAPAVIVGAASVTSILVGHNILHKRNLALAAAYTAVDKSFKQYRGRLIDRFGKQLDRELKYDIKAKEIEEVVVDEKGKEKTVKKTVEVGDPVAACSSYTFCFDEKCSGFDDQDHERNKFFLKAQQDWANELLKTKKHLFLNEVLDMLGIPRCRAGQTVGWTYCDDGENPYGDNYIDFGAFDLEREDSRDFVNGRRPYIWLDFNVDGNILHAL